MDGPGGDYADPIVLPFSITIPDPRPVVNCGMSRLAPVVNHPANGWPEDQPTEDWSLDTILGFATELFGTPSARAEEVPPEERAEEDERRDLEEEKGPDIFDPFPVPRVTAPGGPRIGHMPGGIASSEGGAEALPGVANQNRVTHGQPNADRTSAVLPSPAGRLESTNAQAAGRAGTPQDAGLASPTPEGNDLVPRTSQGGNTRQTESTQVPSQNGQHIAGAVGLRNRPGVATMSKALPPISGPWLRGTDGNAGLIPRQVADRLLGLRFRSFRQFRKTFWRIVADTPELAAQFSQMSVSLMRHGRAPIAPKTQRFGGQYFYHLHHRSPVTRGGEVYDLSNIVIVTPMAHQSILDTRFHFGRKSR